MIILIDGYDEELIYTVIFSKDFKIDIISGNAHTLQNNH